MAIEPWLMAGSSLISSILGNRANERAYETQTGNEKELLQTALKAGGSTDAFQDVAFDGTGYVRKQVGAPSAVEARETLTKRDKYGASRIDDLMRQGIQSPVPTMADATNIISQRDQGTQALADSYINKLVSSRNRLGQGVNNSNFDAATAGKMNEFAIANKQNSLQDAIGLFQNAQQGATGNFAAKQAAYSPLVPAPGFQTGTPVPNIASAVMQQRPSFPSVNTSAQAPFLAFNQGLQGSYNMERQATSDKLIQELLNRQLSNEGAA